MKIVWKVLQVLLSIFLIYAGIQHFLKPEFYEPFVPTFLPAKTMMVYASGIVEIVLGVLMFIPKYTKLGATGVILLMLIFLPIHISDVFSDIPAIGNHDAALIRLPFQFLFIAWAYAVRRFV
ncbi:DoxX family membrane protein [Maribacter algarum]|uniref:DoxX family membrane protein n=1 Tax=Maribacter algarum (ex Zhang et al. 2020) TaxID=2578118 RepID=A0A5S3PRE4_9FLAO|nr:MauE/DoxX family redox-associated membrane protein [Maribacter algarum]TMM57317.1 DoxX family membrane protein [Maribacter algarum]